MKIVLAVKNQGPVPALKNSKRSAQRKDGTMALFTQKKVKQWMTSCIASFESQLFCLTRIGDAETLTEPQARSLTASSLPHDDSWGWIPELHVYAKLVKPGEEGAHIIIEKL